MLMSLRYGLAGAGALLTFALMSAGGPPTPRGAQPPIPAVARTKGGPLVGRWHVEFANGVIETCTVTKDGRASVVEPRRSAAGKVTVKDGSFIIACTDDRVERWTPVGTRMVVEHWFPASQVPVVAPVLGIAERIGDTSRQAGAVQP
jgi:hypothetical protein